MTGNDIKNYLELYLTTTVDSDKVVLIINECLNIIGDLALNYEVIEVTPGENGWGKLPEDTTAVVSVEQNGKPYDNWTTRGLSIKLGSLGVYDVVLRRMIPQIEELADEIKIHPLFKSPIIAYTRGMWKVIENEDSQDGHRLLEQFKEEALKAYNILKNVRERGV